MIRYIILLVLATAVFSKEGIDFSYYEGNLTQEDISCFAVNKSFAIIEIWRHQWGISPYFIGDYEKSQAVGFEFIDVYAFVCNECEGNTPQNICQSINSTLPSDFNGRLWIDIEPCTGCWSTDYPSNLQFVEDVVTNCSTYGWKLGIYSSKYSWSGVVGAEISTELLTSLPLWYAHYDHNDNFTDFNEYGVANWTAPFMKQYMGDTPLCGISVDLDYYPDSEIVTQ